uniref:Uncharacterized protein n=2 Tax=unclassified Caudoviricetes TaxID=2788787 RepID=A0A8S5MWD6_9CAUD|nr:MAG TPA: hypothetical protein [Siphoviridae sp. ctsBB38]DAF99141.1 MAG TPA: hypothetical protein [Siphoviridae sp. ctOxh11]
MIKITVDTKKGVQIIKEGTLIKGTLKDLLFELTALHNEIVNNIVEQNKENLQPGIDPLTAKFNMVDTIAETTKVALERDHKYTSDTSTTVQHIKPLQEPKEAAEEITVDDIIKGGLGIDMDKLTWEIYATNELIDKWWPIMNDHIMTDEEMKQLQKEAKEAGVDMDDLLNAMIEKYEKMED